MAKKEKAKYDAVALCKFMEKLMFMMAGCVLIWFFDELYPDFHLFTIGQLLLIAILVFAFIYANMGGRFKAGNQNGESNQ